MSHLSLSTSPPPYSSRRKEDMSTRSSLKTKSKSPSPSTVYHITGDVVINNSGPGSRMIFHNGSIQHPHLRTNITGNVTINNTASSGEMIFFSGPSRHPHLRTDTHYHCPMSTSVSAPSLDYNISTGVQHHITINNSGSGAALMAPVIAIA